MPTALLTLDDGTEVNIDVPCWLANHVQEYITALTDVKQLTAEYEVAKSAAEEASTRLNNAQNILDEVAKTIMTQIAE